MTNTQTSETQRPSHVAHQRLVRHPARIQWKPNYIPSEKRLCLTRIRWERGTVGDGKGYSSKLSVSLILEPRDVWVGLYWKCDTFTKTVWLCLLPCLPIRIKLHKSWGGIFP